MSLISATHIKSSLALLISLLFITACYNSSSSDPGNAQSSVDASSSTATTETSDTATVGGSSEMEDGTISDATNGFQAVSTEDNNESVSGDLEPSIPDPMTQNSTQVEFTITVPAYQSNALQVQLMWDSKVFNAGWVGDELWVASDSFPTNTEYELTVTFSDANGGITLGQYKTEFKTGSNESENVQVLAEQFNIGQWDDDEDGTSNIDELIAGTDPLVDEDASLEIRESAVVSLSFIADNFESRIPAERPYNEYHEEQLVYHDGGRPPSGALHTIEISIDEIGNGTLSDSRLEGVGFSPLRTSYIGTRTHSENTIQWDGKRQTSQDELDLYITTTSVNTVSIVDERTRKYAETYRYNYDTSDEDTYTTVRQIALIGEIIDGTAFCQPVAGTFDNQTTSPRDINGTNFHTTITKDIDDQYWRVKSTVTGSEFSEIEYLARIFDANFQCEFVEFQ